MFLWPVCGFILIGLFWSLLKYKKSYVSILTLQDTLRLALRGWLLCYLLPTWIHRFSTQTLSVFICFDILLFYCYFTPNAVVLQLKLYYSWLVQWVVYSASVSLSLSPRMWQLLHTEKRLSRVLSPHTGSQFPNVDAPNRASVFKQGAEMQ